MKQDNNYKGLRYKIKANDKMQRGLRVYFCCHEKDFSEFFTAISSEVFSVQNDISIWYMDPDDEILDCEEYFWDLSQMRLFIVLVTEKFLCEACHARRVEFAYAVEHHIPVLPIVQEKGLEDLFNNICGEMQFLKRYVDDTTAISYKIKLDNFLNTLLLNEETITNIRKAFDAYIFLSYRQKDRIYVEGIMDLIHADDRFRDIAIWYDEFLTPGENFNDGIKDAIIKSSVFAIVVTPNLISESNYIMDIEYPLAKKLGKEIFPIEVAKTDMKILEKCYSGINSVISIDNKVDVYKNLEKKIKGTILGKNKDDAQHNYFIGLAYLNGIDVEINLKRGVRLITFAAEQGLPEACVRLVRMYRHGEYVQQNTREAAKWKEKYIEYLESLDNCDEEFIIHQYIDLGYLKREIHGFAPWKKINELEKREYDESIKIQTKILKYYEKKYYENCNSNENGLRLAHRYFVLGDTLRARGDKEGYANYYEKGARIRHYILEKKDDTKSKISLISSYAVMVDVYCNVGKYAKASECCVEGLGKAYKILEKHSDEMLVSEILYLYRCMLRNCIDIDDNIVVDNMIKGVRIVGEILLDFKSFEAYIEYMNGYSVLCEQSEYEYRHKEKYELLRKTLVKIILPECDFEWLSGTKL